MSVPLIAPPAWLAGRTWYHLHPLGALACERRNPDPSAPHPHAHRLGRLLDWLDHLTALGVGGLMLAPVFVSESHGYDTVDPFRVDQRLGDEPDLVRLVEACHARDVKVVLDGVFNHVGRAFPPFVDVLRHRRDSPHRDWFRLDFERGGPDGFAYRDFEGHRQLVALNHHGEVVLRWAVEVATHWLARGVDGWRLDAAYAVPTTFWAAFAEQVRARFPEAFLFGEVIHGDYARVVRESGLHAVTQYELHKAIWSALNDENAFELSWALERHAAYCRTFVPVTFVGNHDVTRVLSRLRDPRHLAHALAVLFTVPGSPCVYYGDELAMRGVKEKREGGDDAIRPPLPASPVGGTPEAGATFGLYRDLIAMRRQRPWLTTADVAIAGLAKHQLQLVVSAGRRALLVGWNVGPAAVPIADRSRPWRPLLGAGMGPIPPHGWTILESA